MKALRDRNAVLLVVHPLLTARVSDSLIDTSVQLALEAARVQHGADVGHSKKIEDPVHASLNVTSTSVKPATYANVLPFRGRSLTPLAAPTGLRGKLFAFTDANIYDVSNSSVSAPASVFTLSGTAGAGHVEGTQFVAGGGNYLCVCSETDGYLYYSSGTGWVKPVQGTGAGQIGLSGSANGSGGGCHPKAVTGGAGGRRAKRRASHPFSQSKTAVAVNTQLKTATSAARLVQKTCK